VGAVTGRHIPYGSIVTAATEIAPAAFGLAVEIASKICSGIAHGRM
jgi:hypothetical protein